MCVLSQKLWLDICFLRPDCAVTRKQKSCTGIARHVDIVALIAVNSSRRTIIAVGSNHEHVPVGTQCDGAAEQVPRFRVGGLNISLLYPAARSVAREDIDGAGIFAAISLARGANGERIAVSAQRERRAESVIEIRIRAEYICWR